MAIKALEIISHWVFSKNESFSNGALKSKLFNSKMSYKSKFSSTKREFTLENTAFKITINLSKDSLQHYYDKDLGSWHKQ